MTLLADMVDANLFGRHFAGDSWRPWLGFIGAATGEFSRLAPDLQQLAVACTGRTDLADAGEFAEVWAICGRRSGKSRIAAAIACQVACFNRWRQLLAPGEVATIAVIASDRPQARMVYRYVRALIRETPLLARMLVRETAERIELTNRSAIEVFASSSVSLRGYTLACCVLDEIAYWPTDGAADPDTEILAAIRPAMVTLPGAKLIAISSPYARRGALFEAWRDNHGIAGADVFVWSSPSIRMNCTIPPATIAAAMAKDEMRARAEWLGEFRNDSERLFSREVIEAAVIEGRRELPRMPGTRYFCFVDPSGGSSDGYAAAVCHREQDRVVMDALRVRQPPFSPEAVTGEYARLALSYGAATVTGDRYGGEWPVEQFRKHGVSYLPSARSKSEIYLEALPLLNASNVELLDHPHLVQQLVALERRVSRGGREAVDHPISRGSHDDAANACCGALVLASAGSRARVDLCQAEVFGSSLIAAELGPPDDIRTMF